MMALTTQNMASATPRKKLRTGLPRSPAAASANFPLLFDFTHARNADDQGRDDDRHDNHFYQPKEHIANRLQIGSHSRIAKENG